MTDVNHDGQTVEGLRQYPKSVLERGYGVVGKYVMQDRELHVIAKAIYSYVCTFGNTAFPGRDRICYDLQINKGTYAKYIKQLVDYGYITVVQKRGENQTFCRNIYEVNLDPQRVLERRAQEVARSEELAPKETADPSVSYAAVYGETVHGETPEKSPCPISPYTVKPDTNNTSVNITRFVVALNYQDDKKTTTSETTTSEWNKSEEGYVCIHSEEEEPSGKEITRQKDPDTIREETGAVPGEVIVSFPGGQSFSAENPAAESELIAVLGEFGIQPNTAKGFMRQYGFVTILEKCRYLRRLVGEGKGKNPGGWLRRALEQGYVDGKGIAEEIAAKERKRRQEVIAAQKARFDMELKAEWEEDFGKEGMPEVCNGLHGHAAFEAFRLHLINLRNGGTAKTEGG